MHPERYMIANVTANVVTFTMKMDGSITLVGTSGESASAVGREYFTPVSISFKEDTVSNVVVLLIKINNLTSFVCSIPVKKNSSKIEVKLNSSYVPPRDRLLAIELDKVHDAVSMRVDIGGVYLIYPGHNIASGDVPGVIVGDPNLLLRYVVGILPKADFDVLEGGFTEEQKRHYLLYLENTDLKRENQLLMADVKHHVNEEKQQIQRISEVMDQLTEVRREHQAALDRATGIYRAIQLIRNSPWCVFIPFRTQHKLRQLLASF